jgi:hypothetical protein
MVDDGVAEDVVIPEVVVGHMKVDDGAVEDLVVDAAHYGCWPESMPVAHKPSRREISCCCWQFED